MRVFSELFHETLRLWLFGLFKIPLLFWCFPRVLRWDEEGCTIGIRLNRRTRNHLGSMYFGALCVGADCAGGFMAYQCIRRSRANVSLVFKDFRAEFLRRPDGDVEFACNQGHEVSEFVKRVLASAERQEMIVRVEARVPGAPDPSLVVARFELTLSLKKR